MTLIAYNELHQMVADGVITADPDNINAASIDITLDNIILQEYEIPDRVIDISKKETIETFAAEITNGFALIPGGFILASSKEVFNLPNNISAEYKLKSSMARCGLEHLNAGWCDAGWHGSKLTLELKNLTQFHTLRLEAGMKIGQVVFFKHEPVPQEGSYATRGRYNNQTKVTAGKGVE